jgi:hypothetical protein
MLGDTDRQRSMDLDVPPLQESDGSEHNPVFDTEPQAMPVTTAEVAAAYSLSTIFKLLPVHGVLWTESNRRPATPGLRQYGLS